MSYTDNLSCKERIKKQEKLEKQTMLHASLVKSMYCQFALFLLMLLLWKIPIYNPIKMLVVLTHEICHVLMAYLTGGVVFGIAIDPGGAGMTLGLGGNFPLIVTAGYAGSMIIGAILYYLSALWESREVWFILLLFSSTTMVFNWFNDFTRYFSIFSFIFLLIGLFLFSQNVRLFLLRGIATCNCLYPVLDILSEWDIGKITGFSYQGKIINSDLGQLSTITGLPPAVIALSTMTLGLTFCIYLMWKTGIMEANQEVKKALFLSQQPIIPINKGYKMEENLTYYDDGPYSSEYKLK